MAKKNNRNKRKKQRQQQNQQLPFDVQAEWNLIFEMSQIMYVDWSKIQGKLTDQLLQAAGDAAPAAAAPPPRTIQPADLAILVPGLGNSTLTKNLRDCGFTQIRELIFPQFMRPDFLSRDINFLDQLSDFWDAEFVNETFDAVVDKGGVDLLAVRDNGFLSSGALYVNKVKRILKPGGKYICITSAETELLDLVFRNFQCGWKTSLYALPTQYDRVQTFMMVFEKDLCATICQISSFLNDYSHDFHLNSHGKDEVKCFKNALARERKFRSKYSDLRTLKELNRESLKELEPGRTIKLVLGDPCRCYYYKAVLVDAEQHPEMPFLHQFAAYVVPKARVKERCFSSEGGQMQFASNLRAARLLIILLDSSHAVPPEDIIQGDLSILARPFAPRTCYESTILILPSQ